MKDLFFAACLLVGTAATSAPIIAPPPPIAAELQQYVRVPSGRIALTHVRVIDGTGAAACGGSNDADRRCEDRRGAASFGARFLPGYRDHRSHAARA